MFFYRPGLRTLPEELVFVSDEGKGILLYIEPETRVGKGCQVLPMREARGDANTYPTPVISDLQGYRKVSPAEAHRFLTYFERANWRGDSAQFLDQFRVALQQAEAVEFA